MHATRIALDMTPLQTGHRFRGVGRYTRHLVPALAALPGDETVYLLAYRAPLDLPPLPPRFRVRYLPHFARLGRAAALFSHQVALPLLLRRLGVDLFHAPCLSHDPSVPGLPLLSSVPTVVTIHDLMPLHYPATLLAPWRKRAFYHRQLAAARRARHILTDSEHVRRDIIHHLQVADSQVTAVPLGVSTEPALARPAAMEQPYILHVGGDYFNKNVSTLRAAWPLVDSELRLVTPADLGYIQDERLPELYRGAAAFVYPSRFEGFGIPVVEAMACGVPCVVSSHPSLDEAAGDAAVRVDPESPEAIAAAIREALARRDELVPQGLAHARRFTWLETGRVHLQSYADAL